MAIHSLGGRVQEFMEIYCKAFHLKYQQLTCKERALLKRLFIRLQLINVLG